MAAVRHLILAENQSVGSRAVEQRRAQVRADLVAAAERTVEREGLRGLRARSLATEGGWAGGAISNAVEDLQELVLLVNARTLRALEAELAAADRGAEHAGPDAAIARLVRMALAYLDFAAAHTPRWRALFEHRMPPGQSVPEWYRDQQR